MAKIRVMSYLDQGAPQYPSDQRDAMLNLLKNVNTTTYNKMFPSTLTVDSNSKTINLSFSATHGFKEGHLLEISNTTSNVFQTDSYRVISTPSATTLVCKIDNYSTVTYPAADNSSTMFVRHKPLDWEVVFSSSTQYSIRSKNAASTKNILTLKEPSLARLKFNVATYSAPACVAVHVSPTVNPSTGEVLSSYTEGHNVSGVESCYWSAYHNNWTSTSVTPSAANIAANDHLLPWFIIGDDKFFYLIVGAYTDTTSYALRYRNPNRGLGNTNWVTYRQCYGFGDPDFLGDPAYKDMGGTILSCCFKPGGTNNAGYTSDLSAPSFFATNLRSNNIISTATDTGTFFIRPLDMSGVSMVPVSYSTIDHPLTSTSYNMTSTGNLYMAYPHTSTRGLIFFPIYLRSYVSGVNYLNYYRSLLPFARFCPINTSNFISTYLSVDYVLLKSSNGSQILSIVQQGTESTLYSAFLYELD